MCLVSINIWQLTTVTTSFIYRIKTWWFNLQTSFRNHNGQFKHVYTPVLILCIKVYENSLNILNWCEHFLTKF